MAAATAAAVAAPIVMGAIGNAMSQGDRNSAANMQQAALQKLLSVNAPSVASQELNMDAYTSQGEINPILQGLAQQGQTGLEGIQTDPRLQAAQMDALSRLQAINSGGGLDDIMKSQLFDSRNNAAAEAQAQNGAIREEMARRGQSGGGLEMLNRMMANQAAQSRLASQDMQASAQAQQNALSSLMNQAQLGGAMQSQSYQQQAQAKQAQDAINQFNTANKNNQMGANAGIQNQAQATNLKNRQNLANANVDLKNQQQQYNKELLQKKFTNDLNLANAQSGGYNQAADQKNKSADATANMWGSMGAGAGKIIGGMG